MGEKRCRKCGEVKPLSEFHFCAANKTDGRKGRCKACAADAQRDRHARDPDRRRWTVVLHRYGITKADFDALYDAQDGACALCGKTDGAAREAVGERYWLHIDHDHETGRVRGLLCFACNNGLGFFSTPELLARADEYLRRTRLVAVDAA